MPSTAEQDRVLDRVVKVVHSKQGVQFGGRTPVSFGADETIRVWGRILRNEDDDDELEEDVCRLVGNALSKAEWDRYVIDTPYRRSCP